jgi:hypothetical protein
MAINYTNKFEDVGVVIKALNRMRETALDTVSAPTSKALTGATAADPVVITSSSHGLSSGDRVMIQGVGGMTDLNGNEYTVSVVNANSFQLKGVDGSGLFGVHLGRRVGAVESESSVSIAV